MDVWALLLEPKDIINFALVSTRVHSAGRPFLEQHRQLMSQYSTLHANENPYLSMKALCFDHVRNDPRGALYVRHLFVGGVQDSDGEHETYTASERNAYIEAMQDSRFIPRDAMDYWAHLVGSGNQASLLALLMALLPNVTMMSIHVDYNSITHYIQEVVEHVAKTG